MQFVDLSHYEFIRIGGEDRHKFLQGQVSCDISLLTEQQSQRGALCNLKGRVIGDFRALERGDDIWLQTQAGMAETIINVLKKYAVFSKVNLEVMTEAVSCIGLFGEDGASQLCDVLPSLPDNSGGVCTHDDLAIIRVNSSQARFEAWCFSASQSAMNQLRSLPEARLEDWYAQQMRAGELHVTPELSEEYTPQLLNYDISGVINFKKGCYTGQEVVARMFYRGQAKKRLFLFESSQPIVEAAKTLRAGESEFPVLQVSNGSSAGNLLFAVVDIAVTDSGQPLSLGEQPDSEITLLPLGYGEQSSRN